MRRWAVAPAAVVVLLPVLAGTPAGAAPAEAVDLCVSDQTRGQVPEDFLLHACVDGAGIVLHNDRSRPVVVRASGDVGAPVGLREENSVIAAVVRMTVPDGAVLLPGEVGRWPIGAGDAVLTVAPMPVVGATEIATELGEVLERPAPAPALQQSVAALIADVSAVLGQRTACEQGRNFLGTTACDVDAAAAVGSATVARLDPVTAHDLLPVVLDPENWDEWTAVEPDWPEDAGATLRQLPVPPAPVPVAVAVAHRESPPPAAGPDPRSSAVQVTAPSPAPAPAPPPAPAAPAQAAAAPRAAAPPRAATPPRAVTRAPAPAPPQQERSTGPAGHDRDDRHARDRDDRNRRDRDRDDRHDRDRGKGGHGHGKGRGNGR